MLSLLRTRAARRWLTWLSAVLGVVGVLGLAGGFEDRTYPAPPERAVGADIELARFVFRVDGAEWAPPTDDEPAAMLIRMRVTNTSQDTASVPRYMVFTRLPDDGLLPTEDDYASFRRHGPAEILPLIPADGSFLYTDGVPAQKPDEVVVVIFDEQPMAAEGVYAEGWTVSDLPVAVVRVPVVEEDA